RRWWPRSTPARSTPARCTPARTTAGRPGGASTTTPTTARTPTPTPTAATTTRRVISGINGPGAGNDEDGSCSVFLCLDPEGPQPVPRGPSLHLARDRFQRAPGRLAELFVVLHGGQLAQRRQGGASVAAVLPQGHHRGQLHRHGLILQR